MIHSTETTIKPRLGQPCSLGVGHVDGATLALTLHYQELVETAGTWNATPQSVALILGEHYELDAPTGRVTLLAHPLWETAGLWRAADRAEPLLYKGAVTAPQYIAATFEHYAPAEVSITADKKVVAADGVEEVTLTVECEDESVTTVPVAVLQDGEKFATLQVTGERVLTASYAGRYRFEADRDELDPAWGLPVFGPAVEGGSVEVEAV